MPQNAALLLGNAVPVAVVKLLQGPFDLPSFADLNPVVEPLCLFVEFARRRVGLIVVCLIGLWQDPQIQGGGKAVVLEALVALSVPSIINDNLAIRFFNQVPDVVNGLNFLGPDAQEVLNCLSIEDRFV